MIADEIGKGWMWKGKVAQQCESPIETILCKLLFDDCGVQAVEGDFAPNRFTELVRDKPTAYLFAQQKIGRYRVDFLLVIVDRLGCIPIAIECDGRNWHSTQQQIDRDKGRDDQLRDVGCRAVMRFTGVDIVRRPRAVVNDVLTILAAVGVPFEEEMGYHTFRAIGDFCGFPPDRFRPPDDGLP